MMCWCMGCLFVCVVLSGGSEGVRKDWGVVVGCVCACLYCYIFVSWCACQRASERVCMPLGLRTYVRSCPCACLSACASFCVSACMFRQSGYPVRERESVYGKVRWSLHSIPTYMYVCVCVCVCICVCVYVDNVSIRVQRFRVPFVFLRRRGVSWSLCMRV